MHKGFVWSFVLVVVLGIAACSQPRKQPHSDVVQALEEKSGEASLAGTKWTVGDMTLEFKDAAVVKVNPGPSSSLQFQDAEIRYALKDGALLIKGPFNIWKGTFDGTNFVLQDVPGVRQQ